MATELEKIKIQIRLAAFTYKEGALREDKIAIRVADLTMDLALAKLAKLAEQQMKAGAETVNGMRIIDEECKKGFNLTLDQALKLMKECESS